MCPGRDDSLFFVSFTELLVCVLFDVVFIDNCRIELNHGRNWRFAGFVVSRYLCYGGVNVASTRFFPVGSNLFSLSISTLYVCVLRLKLFSRVLDVILLCLCSLWSVGVTEPHWCVLSLCVHAFVSKQRKREKFVAAVETEGDNYDNPVRCPVAFLCINFCMIRGGLFSAQSFPGNVCGMM